MNTIKIEIANQIIFLFVGILLLKISTSAQIAIAAAIIPKIVMMICCFVLRFQDTD
jgi:hypothetical protein